MLGDIRCAIGDDGKGQGGFLFLGVEWDGWDLETPGEVIFRCLLQLHNRVVDVFQLAYSTERMNW